MITIQGKQFRNFAEQVKENKENIDKVKDIQPIINVSGDTVQPYLLTLNFRFYNRTTGQVADSGISYQAYSIVYMTDTEAEQRIANKTFPARIELTRPYSILEKENLAEGYIDSFTAIYLSDINGHLYPVTDGDYPLRLIPINIQYRKLTIELDNNIIQ